MKKVSSKKVSKAKKSSVKAISAAKKSKKLKKSTAKAIPAVKSKAKSKKKAAKQAKKTKITKKVTKTKKAVKIAVRKKAAKKIRKANIRKPKEILESEEIENLIIENRLAAQKLGYSLLRRWGIRVDREELHSVIDHALCDSAIRYIPNKGASFPTYFYYFLRGHLIKLVADLKMATVTHAYLNSDGVHDLDQTTNIYSSIMPQVSVKSELNNSPECLIIKQEELKNCSSSIAKLDRIEQAILTRIYDNEPLTNVARSLGYSRCHVSRIKQQALRKLKAIYSHKVNLGDYPNVTSLADARKRIRSRNKNKLRLSYNATMPAVA